MKKPEELMKLPQDKINKNKTEPKSTREQFEKFWARVQRAHNQEKD